MYTIAPFFHFLNKLSVWTYNPASCIPALSQHSIPNRCSSAVWRALTMNSMNRFSLALLLGDHTADLAHFSLSKTVSQALLSIFFLLKNVKRSCQESQWFFGEQELPCPFWPRGSQRWILLWLLKSYALLRQQQREAGRPSTCSGSRSVPEPRLSKSLSKAFPLYWRCCGWCNSLVNPSGVMTPKKIHTTNCRPSLKAITAAWRFIKENVSSEKPGWSQLSYLPLLYLVVAAKSNCCPWKHCPCRTNTRCCWTAFC